MTNIADIITAASAATGAAPWQYQVGLAAAGFLVGLGTAAVKRWFSKKPDEKAVAK